jgi:hypothetical protein
MVELDNLLSAVAGAVVAAAITSSYERSERRAEEQLRAVDLLVDSSRDYTQWERSVDDDQRKGYARAVKIRLEMARMLGFRHENHWREAIELAEDMTLTDLALDLNIAWLGETRKKVDQASKRLAEMAVKYNRQSYTLTVIDHGGWRLRRRKRKMEEMFQRYDSARPYEAGEVIPVRSSS